MLVLGGFYTSVREKKSEALYSFDCAGRYVEYLVFCGQIAFGFCRMRGCYARTCRDEETRF